MNPTHQSPDPAPGIRVGNPMVMLFGFHIRNAAGLPANQSQGAGALNPETLWQQCIALGETLSIPALKNLKSVLRCYQNGIFAPELEDQTATPAEQPYQLRQLDLLDLRQQGEYAHNLHFHVNLKDQGAILLGEFYPQRIHDTYAIDLTLRLKGSFPLSQLASFAPLQTIQPSLGRTFVLVVEPVDTLLENNLAVANACVAQFLQQHQSHCRPTAQGQFFGNPLFEYAPPDPHHPNRPLHLWVWLNRNPDALNLIDQPEPYPALINLLCALHKSHFAFAQATDCHRQAQVSAQALEHQVNQLSHATYPSLEQWKAWIQAVPATAFHYARLIRDIEDHRITLDTNQQNYGDRLDVLQKCSQAGDDLGFLEQCLTTMTQHQRQIEVWQRYLATSQPLFQQLIDTIRGLVDIAAQEQAQADARREMERDRTLQAGIAAVGTGLAVSGITSQVAPRAIVAMPAEPQHSSWLYWPAFVTNAWFHISLGLCFALIVYKIWLPKKNTRSSNR